jgi:nitroreductase
MEIFSRRQSVRSYKPDPIPGDAVNRCIEAARLAPSANNGQPWEFVIAADTEIKGRLAKAAGFGPLKENPFAAQAPVIVAVSETPGHRPTRWGGYVLGRNFPLMDIGMAVENFCLQAAAEGLGTCIIGLFSAREVRRALKLPGNHRPRLLITMGSPAAREVRIKKRRPLEKMSRYIKGKGIEDGS